MNYYLSVIMVGRNDDYGGEFLQRMQNSITVLLSLCEKYALATELLIVEWNPPAGKIQLGDALQFPKNLRHCGIRIIQVPETTQSAIFNPENLALLEYAAKNAGARRARGEYILVTNPDIIFSDGLIDFLARKSLSSKYFYRIARHNIKTPTKENMEPEEMLAYCPQNIISAYNYWYSLKYPVYQLDNLLKVIEALPKYIILRLMHLPFGYPFCAASGDFFLMHRDNWHKLRGYPELGYNHYIDSYFCYMALTSGIRQKIISSGNARIYHQEHGRRKEAGPDIIEAFRAARKKMMKERKPIIFNDENWGLGKEKLKEDIIQ